MNATCVSLCGPSYYIRWEDGSQEWSGIPRKLDNLLRGREKSRSPLVKFLRLGPEDFWFVMYENGKYQWSPNLPSELTDVLANPPSPICDLSFGSGDWVLQMEEFWHWSCHLSENVVAILNTAQVSRVALGCHDDYIVQHPNGSLSWSLKDNYTEANCEAIKGAQMLVALNCEDFESFFFSRGRKVLCGGNENFTQAIYSEYTFHVPTWQVRFLHNSISHTFKDGHTIYSLAAKLASGEVTVDSIPMIRVVRDETEAYTYWSLDNRRLWAFKAGGVKCIPVQIVPPNDHYYSFKENVFANGFSITVRTNAD